MVSRNDTPSIFHDTQWWSQHNWRQFYSSPQNLGNISFPLKYPILMPTFIKNRFISCFSHKCSFLTKTNNKVYLFFLWRFSGWNTNSFWTTVLLCCDKYSLSFQVLSFCIDNHTLCPNQYILLFEIGDQKIQSSVQLKLHHDPWNSIGFDLYKNCNLQCFWRSYIIFWSLFPF